MIQDLESMDRHQFQYDMVSLTRADIKTGNRIGLKDIDGFTNLPSQEEFNEMKNLLRKFIIEEFPEMIKKGIITRNKVGRNEPCPCDSGKKYKKCCGGVN